MQRLRQIFALSILGLLICALQARGQTLPQFGHVVIVPLENHGYSQVVGSSSMPYLNSLIAKYGLATNYHADTHPSIGNYFMLTAGQIITNDDGQTPSSLPLSVDNIALEVNDPGVEAGTAAAFRLQVGNPASGSATTRLVESTHNLLNTKTGNAASEGIFA